jgi:hypothetical protein
MKYTLGAKFGGLAQKWNRAGLEEGRTGSNNGGWDHACGGGFPMGGDRI